MKLKIPPPVYVLLIGLLMTLADRFLPVMQVVPEPWNIAGAVLVAIAVLMNIWSLRLFAEKKTTFSPMKPKNTSDLVIKGIYKFTRNPMYLGLLAFLSGYAVWLGSLTPMLVLPLFCWVMTEMQIKPEENALEEKFGERYLDYKQSVRRWI